MGLRAGSMESCGKKSWRKEDELSGFVEAALDPSAQALIGISVTIWRFFLPLLGKEVMPKGVRSSILAGATHMSFAGPSPSTLKVGIGEREAVSDGTKIAVTVEIL